MADDGWWQDAEGWLEVPPAQLLLAGRPLLLDAPRSVPLAGVWLGGDPVPSADSPESEDSPGAPADARAGEIALARRLAAVLQPPLELLVAARGPLAWPETFFPYQVAGIGALLTRAALLLADDMGLGKSAQALAALRLLVLQRRAAAALLVVPASLIGQWCRAAAAWAPELRVAVVHGTPAERSWQWRARAHLYLTSYETLRADATANPQSPPRRRTWDVVLLDEAQKIKNADAEVSEKCKQLHRRRAWALTGTPLENRAEDLASILEFVTPFLPGEAPPALLPGPALYRRQQQVQLRRRKADVLPQLPPKVISLVPLKLAGAQLDSYQRAEREGLIHLRRLGRSVAVTHVLELIVRLKQICNFCPATGASAKLADIRDRLEVLLAEGHRALIFSQFTDDQYGVAAVAAGLEAWRPLSYTGALSARQRDVVIERFKAEPSHRILILSLRAGGQGLNLQDAAYVFHLDRWWNPAIERQAEDRSHRLGQQWPVHIYKYSCEGTIEERIDRVLQTKQAIFDQLVDDVSLDLQSSLSRQELARLVGLEEPPDDQDATTE